MDSLTDMISLGLSNIWTYGVTFLAVLGLLVFVHEWGHYIVARLCGVRVETFSIGFGKEIFGWTAKSGTRWKIALFPLGGYVKMFGDADPASASTTDEVDSTDGTKRPMTEEERKGAFFSKSVGKRAAIVFAGPGINYLFAILLLSILYMTSGRPITPPVISGIEVGSAADKAEFQPHDRIISINGEGVDSFDDVRRATLLTLDEEITFMVKRGEDNLTIKATPQKITDTDRFGFAHERGYLGIIGPANGIDIGQIIAVNGVDTRGNVEKAHELIQKNLDKRIIISTDMGKKNSAGKSESRIAIFPTKALNPQLSVAPHTKDYNALILGEKPGDVVIHYNPLKAVAVATSETYRITVETLKAMGQMVNGTRSTKELGGIIRIGAMAGDMAERGYIALVVFTALLSINLGLINLFPIPMLDGGHLVFYAAEAIRGKPLSEKVQELAFQFGLVVLVTLMVFSNLNDILQVFVFKGTPQ